MTFIEKPFAQVRTDKARPTGYKYSHQLRFSRTAKNLSADFADYTDANRI
jgi:hypothetical protein